MTVIAMTRELGTGGQDVVARVAGELGLEIVHDERIERLLVERLGIDEETLRRIVTGEASLWERWKIGVRRISQFTAPEVLAIARQGNVVIRGWGAAQLLRGVPHVTCVRVCAPMSYRIARVRERLGVTDDDVARREIERSDEAHDRVVRAMSDDDWRDPTGYGMVLNTGQMTIDTASEMLLHLARERMSAETAASVQQLDDRLVQARVREALGPAGYGIEITADHGVVTLSGALIADGGAEFLRDKAGSVEGVREVRTDLHVVPYNLGA